MMVTIKPGLLKGRVAVPPSKSITHRAVMAAAMASGKSVISNIDLSKDIEATIGCVEKLGANCIFENKYLTVDGSQIFSSIPQQVDDDGLVLKCNESGSTLRFMIPISLLSGKKITFEGSQSLLERPLGPYENYFKILKNNNSLIISDKLEAGTFELAGDISSQFVTGLLMALPRLSGDSRIIMTSPLQSKPYVDLTIAVLKEFGVDIINNNYESFLIKGDQIYIPCDYSVEGDYSQAAFWLVANALGSDVICEGLNPNSLQGDMAITKILNNEDRVISVREIPDLAPILAVWCSLRKGESKIIDAERLRFKECDRLHAIAEELNRLGAKITEHESSLTITGVDALCGGETYGHNDHRIAMALAIAATRCTEEVIIHGSECVSKSYPMFFEDYFSLKNTIGG